MQYFVIWLIRCYFLSIRESTTKKEVIMAKFLVGALS